MDRKSILTAIGVVLVVAVGIALYLVKGRGTSSPQSASKTIDYSATNPLEKAPDLNPTTKTNPFTKVKTNPFE